MALQQCFSGGRRAILTKLLPRNSTNFRHLSWMGLPVPTQVKNIENINIFASNSSTKWQYLKTPSCNYSKEHRGIEFLRNNVQDDDNTDDGDDNYSKYNDNYSEKYKRKIDRERIETQVEDIFCSKKEMSSAEWKETIELMSRGNSYMNATTCDAMIMKRCVRLGNYSLAASYMEVLQREGREPNLSTLGNYLQLCGEHVATCGEDQVMELYHSLMSRAKAFQKCHIGPDSHPGMASGPGSPGPLKKMSMPCPTIHSAIIRAAFRTGDYEVGWQYLEAMRQVEQVPLDSVFDEWLRQCEAQETRAEREAMALTLFQKLENHDVHPSVAVVKAMTRLFRDALGWSAHYLKIPKSGVCPACRHQLDVKGVTEEDFRHLQEEFVPRVLLGSDIFRSTSPEEWSNFQRFVEERKPFAAVVDGLNASYIITKNSEMSRQKSLGEVVDQALVEHPRGNILVLGRNHMEKWTSRLWRNKPRVTVYTLNNMSKDDGFFLYAALQSGLGTKFLTGDLLRDHLFRLGEGPLRDIFRRWQNTHQVMAYSSAGCIRLMSPAKFSTVIQASQAGGVDGWHVPYDDGAPRQSYEVPPTWLCLHPSLTMPSPLPSMVSREPLTYDGSRKLYSPPKVHRRVPRKDNQLGDVDAYNGTWKPYSPLPKVNRRVLPKDNQLHDGDRVKYKTPMRETSLRKQQQNTTFHRSQRGVYDNDVISSNPPSTSWFPTKRRKDGFTSKKGTKSSISEINLNTLFDEGKERS
ncbi:Mitochondrial ribonuclease P catalytic subunit [Chionoecetes opilio]|uniref:Mitochondrial ribonuclease P catalytic subunit n=1 Tax=Chionoecetes opilio TaxID=41210 RepID=A0A8J5CWF2_CHIOP|nr:Mitochondrial ribonuclease P catalytic subunit [Chionoecetes opilio]